MQTSTTKANGKTWRLPVGRFGACIRSPHPFIIWPPKHSQDPRMGRERHCFLRERDTRLLLSIARSTGWNTRPANNEMARSRAKSPTEWTKHCKFFAKFDLGRECWPHFLQQSDIQPLAAKRCHWCESQAPDTVFGKDSYHERDSISTRLHSCSGRCIPWSSHKTLVFPPKQTRSRSLTLVLAVSCPCLTLPLHFQCPEKSELWDTWHPRWQQIKPTTFLRMYIPGPLFRMSC